MRILHYRPQLVFALALFVLVFAMNACTSNNGVSSSADTASDGRDIFQKHCASCHSTGTEQSVGPGLAGLFSSTGPTLPPNVDYGGKLPNGNEITEAHVANWIREGGRGEIGWMPGNDISEQEMAALIAYLKTL